MPDRSLATLAPLADPVRRALYEFVASQPDAVDREGAAMAVGIARPLAAFHLDRLVAVGLFVAEYRRRGGRSGPGAGRPAKFYRRSPHVEIDVSLPPRRYDVAAEILAAAVDGSAGATARALKEARQRGRTLARATQAVASGDRALLDVLRSAGYEPAPGEDDTIRLRNCPFDSLVSEHRDLTCSINLALLDALATGLGEPSRHAVLRPEESFCCVALPRAASA